jgi:23S rRNA pseudouridine1911/1915/1917 synthase
LINESLLVKKSGIRLDKYLAEKYDDISRSQIQKYIKSNDILVNGIPQSSKYLVNENDEISLNISDEIIEDYHIEPQDIPLNIIFEDDYIIIVNKSAGLTVHPGVGKRDGTLVNALAYHFKYLSDLNGPMRPGIVHRLDMDTSGIIIVAKNNTAHMKLAEQFSARKVTKVYFGITWGKWKVMEGIIDESIGRKRNDPMTYQVNINGKEATTHYKILKETEYFSFVNYFPKTGRTHQLRVHSAIMGHPIVGDEKYGGGEVRIKGYIPEIGKKMRTVLNSVNRHILHAQSITFIHPKTENEVSFEAELPEDIQNVIEKIELLNV